MAESGLDEVDRRAAVQSVTGMGVAHPVGRGFLFEAGAFPRCIHDSPDLRNVEVSTLPAPKDRIGSRSTAAQFHQHPPGASLQQNRARPASFAEHRNLTAVFPALLTTLHGVAPLQAREFGDADAGGVEQAENDLVAAVGGAVDHARDVAFGQNALGEAVAVGPELQGDTDVESEITGLLPEGKQRLEGGEGAILARGLQALGIEEAAYPCKSASITEARGFATNAKKRSTSKR